MLDKILSFIAPHYCSGCDEIGSSLCYYCKYNIADDKSVELHSQVRVIGDYKGVLGDLIKSLKFERNKSAARILGGLLHESLPDYGSSVVVVPVPTVEKHIRQRGYDHMLLIAREFSRLRGYKLSGVLLRNSSSVQVGMNAKMRLEQAKKAFTTEADLNSSDTFLLIDDVLTTGATLNNGAKSMRLAGAGKVYRAAIVRQTLD